jgi:CubicO group peptidase (beta-lactamase class C family)
MDCYDEHTLHPQNSATKTLLSTMIGMLIHDGYLDGVHQKVHEFFPEAGITPENSKYDMTLHHVLGMYAGLPWLVQRGSLDFMLCEEDAALAAFMAPQRRAPGRIWAYDGGAGMQVLQGVIERVTGRCYFELLQERIFGPLGMTSAEWRLFNTDGTVKGSAGLYMTTRDMARYGTIYVNDGKINGRRVLPEGWVEETFFNNRENMAWFVLLPYNRLWWGNTPLESVGRSARAQGFGGQLISVFPDTGIVVARTGGRGPLGDGDGGWPLIRNNGDFLYLLPVRDRG